MTITMRGECRWCGCRRQIRRDGMIRNHYIEINYQGVLCPGSNGLPAEMTLDPENNYFCNVGCSGCRDIIDYGI